MLWLNPVVKRVNLPSAHTYPSWRSRRVFFFSVKAFKHISQKYFQITVFNESNINQMMFETSLPIVYRTRRKPLSTFKGFESNNHLNLIWCLCIYTFKLVSVSVILNSALVWVLLSYFCFQMPCAIFSLKEKSVFHISPLLPLMAMTQLY